MLTPLDSDTPKYEPDEVKQEISKVLSLDELEDKQESISYKKPRIKLCEVFQILMKYSQQTFSQFLLFSSLLLCSFK